MRPKTLILFIVAIGCGLIASIGVSQYMEKAKAGGAPGVQTAKIYVATTEISPGEQLDAKNVRLEEWPKDRVPEGAVGDLKELEEKFSRTRMFKGEPILHAKISDKSDINNVEATIPQGYRVVATKVEVSQIAGGLVRPGNRVDLVVFLRKSAEIPETGTRTILRDVNVFAVDAETERQEDKQFGSREVRTVSLLVTPKQAESVTLAKELGILSLILRRPGDPVEEIGDGETIRSLLGHDGENANEKKKNNQDESESGLLDMLAKNSAVTTTPAVAPQPVVEIQPPKFKMIIRSPNGDRTFHFKDLDSPPEEIDEHVPLAPTKPAVVPPHTVSKPGAASPLPAASANQGPVTGNNASFEPDPAPDANTEDPTAQGGK